MRSFARTQWQGLSRLWHRGSKQGWQPRHFAALLFLGGATLAVSICAYISYQVVRGLILDSLKENALLRVKKESNEIEQWLATRKAEVETIASTPIARSLDRSAVEPYLKIEQNRLKEFFAILLAKSDGSYYTSKGGQGNLKDRKHFQKAMAGQLNVSDPLKGRSSGTPQVVIGAPIWSISPNNPQPIGELAGAVSIDQLERVVSHLKYGSGSYAFALNSEGVPIVHPDRRVMGNLDKPAPSFLEAPDPNLRAIAHYMVGDRDGIKLTQIDGNWVYVAYIPLQQADWSIALVIPRGNLEKELRSLNLLAAVVGGLLAIAVLIGVRLVLTSELSRVRAEREALLNRLIGRIRASLDLDRILQTTVEEVGTLLHLKRAAFGWNDAEQKVLDIKWEYCQSPLPPQVGRFNWSLCGDLEAQLQQGEALLLREATEGSEGCSDRQLIYLELKAHSYLALPILTPEKLMGYLLLSRGTRWFSNEEENELLQAVANQLAIAITQSQLYTQTTEQVKLLAEALGELKRTHTHLVQSEKMSSLGQMVAGIAHEINNPVNFIYGNLPHATEYVEDLLKLVFLYKDALPNLPAEIRNFETQIELDFIESDLPPMLNSMKVGADRIRSIVLSLRNFSRLDEAAKKPVDLHEGIDNTLLLLTHKLKDKIQIIKHYGDLPQVECYPSQLNQVFMNLLSNAIDALEEGNKQREIEKGAIAVNGEAIENTFMSKFSRATPTITITTVVIDNLGEDYVRICIADNGPGILPEIAAKIFDPFFTTKPVGKGTGLGLAISYQIVVDVHGGQISVETPATGGTQFVVEIPLNNKTNNF